MENGLKAVSGRNGAAAITEHAIYRYQQETGATAGGAIRSIKRIWSRAVGMLSPGDANRHRCMSWVFIERIVDCYVIAPDG